MSFCSSCGLNDDDVNDAYDDNGNDEDDNDDDEDGSCKRASHGPLCGFPASTLRLTVDLLNCILTLFYILLHSTAFCVTLYRSLLQQSTVYYSVC